MTTYTINYRFALVDYGTYGWKDAIDKNFISIDALLAQFNINLSLQGVWTNNTMYAAGVSVIDAATGHIWYNSIAHTSALAPITFDVDRANNPSYWTDVTNPAIPAATSAATAVAAANTVTAAIANSLTFRNRLINGDMAINQRAAATTIVASGTSVYTLDRWLVTASGSSVYVYQNNAAAYTSNTQLRMTSTLNVGNSFAANQRIESANSYDLVGKQVTVQVNMACYTASGATTFAISLYAPTSTDNFASLTLLQTVPIAPTNVPGTYTATFNALPYSVINGLQVSVVGTQQAASSVVDCNVTSIQLEIGSGATGFERAPRDLSLLRCQRYYQRIGFNFLNYGGAGGTIGVATMTLICSMRINPTGSIVAPSSFSNCNNPAVGSSQNNSITITAQSIAAGAFQYSGVAELISEL